MVFNGHGYEIETLAKTHKLPVFVKIVSTFGQKIDVPDTLCENTYMEPNKRMGLNLTIFGNEKLALGI